MNIAVMGETAAGENRVALIPSSVPKLQKLGCEISVVSGAGTKAHYQDQDYEQAFY